LWLYGFFNPTNSDCTFLGCEVWYLFETGPEQFLNAFEVFKDVAALIFPSLDMAGVREHVKNRQGNHFVALQDFTNQKFEDGPIELRETPKPSRKYSKSDARASGLQEMYRILGNAPLFEVAC